MATRKTKGDRRVSNPRQPDPQSYGLSERSSTYEKNRALSGTKNPASAGVGAPGTETVAAPLEVGAAVIVTGGLSRGAQGEVVGDAGLMFRDESVLLVDLGGTLGVRSIREGFLARRSA